MGAVTSCDSLSLVLSSSPKSSVVPGLHSGQAWLINCIMDWQPGKIRYKLSIIPQKSQNLPEFTNIGRWFLP